MMEHPQKFNALLEQFLQNTIWYWLHNFLIFFFLRVPKLRMKTIDSILR
jgi:hypothetical protein